MKKIPPDLFFEKSGGRVVETLGVDFEMLIV